MKRVKTVLAIALAFAMLFVMNTTVFAAGEGSITIDNAVVGKTYTIYRIFDLNSHNDDYSAINYKVSTKWAGFFAAGAQGLDYVDIDEQGYVTWKSGADAVAFAADASAYAQENGIAHDGEKKATDGTVVFENLELGYYLVHSDLGTLCSLDTTMPNVTIKEKNGEPTAEKEVQEDSNAVWSKVDDADISDTVNFKTTVKVTDGNPKNYVLHDKMSEGLTYTAGSVKVSVNGTQLTQGYTLTEGCDDGCTFEIEFADGTLKPNDVVTVEYAAVLNENAVVAGKGNPNTTWLSYGEKKTQESVTRTYTWTMGIFKYAVKNNEEIPLAGAQFVLYKTVGEKTLYATVEGGKLTGWTEDKAAATALTTPETGAVSVIGLDADTYYLEETKAPDGYNTLKDPIEIKITAEIDEVTNEGIATIRYGEGSTGEVRVENKTGTELPATGGIGTKIFYIVGGLLVVAAAILLITRKRMGKTED